MTSATHTRARRAAIVGLSAVIAACILLAGCSSAKPSSRAEERSSAEEVQVTAAKTGGGIHGAGMGDRLDDTSEPSLALDDAIKCTRSKLSLPDEALTGGIVKVVLNETVTDPTGKGRVGLMILFESGVKLFTEPGAKDLRQYNESFRDALPFRDGRELPCELRSVGGRPTLVGDAGIQYNNRGEVATPATLIWNVGDVNYLLKAPEPSAAPASTMRTSAAEGTAGSPDVEDLVRMAESLAPVEQ